MKISVESRITAAFIECSVGTRTNPLSKLPGIVKNTCTAVHNVCASRLSQRDVLTGGHTPPDAAARASFGDLTASRRPNGAGGLDAGEWLLSSSGTPKNPSRYSPGSAPAPGRRRLPRHFGSRHAAEVAAVNRSYVTQARFP